MKNVFFSFVILTAMFLFGCGNTQIGGINGGEKYVKDVKMTWVKNKLLIQPFVAPSATSIYRLNYYNEKGLPFGEIVRFEPSSEIQSFEAPPGACAANAMFKDGRVVGSEYYQFAKN